MDEDPKATQNAVIKYLRHLILALGLGLSAATVCAEDLKIDVLIQGQGDAAEIGQQVGVHYTGKLTDGAVFDSSRTRGEPFYFILGQGQVIQGWEQGVLGMKQGEQRTLTIPPTLGYGARGAGGLIPPNATLIFDVELMSITQPPKLSSLSNDAFAAARGAGATVIDIRRPEEWQETGIIEGAETITAFTETGQLHPDFNAKFSALVQNLDQKIVLYCRTGNRTEMLGNALVSQLGFRNISHLKDGIVGWTGAAQPTVPFVK